MKKIVIRRLVIATAIVAVECAVPATGLADIRSSSSKSVEAVADGSATADERKLVAAMKKMFTEPRVSSCKAPARTTPSATWPARGEPAVAFCLK